jgi:hypothetical protein
MLKTLKIGGQLYVQFPARKTLVEQPAMGEALKRLLLKLPP